MRLEETKSLNAGKKVATHVDVNEALNKMDCNSLFKGRYDMKKFQTSVVKALEDYRISLESVISSRGYSISAITINKPHDKTNSFYSSSATT